MTLYFDDYRFDTEKQTLYKGNEIVALKRNQTALLAFFLSEPESIHSKDRILEVVWGQQVVSEQVVFQTISQLRAILGSNTIKTYAKKGYCFTPNVTTQGASIQKNENLPNDKVVRRKIKYGLTGLCLIVLLVCGYFLFPSKMCDSAPDVTYLDSQNQNTAQQNVDLKKVTEAMPMFNVKYIKSDVLVSDVFSAPHTTKGKHNIDTHEWMLWTDVLQTKDTRLIHYGLLKGSLLFDGYIQVKQDESLATALSRRMHALNRIGIFSLEDTQLERGLIKTLLNKSPDDPDLLSLSANYHYKQAQDDIALSYLDKLTQSQSVSTNIAYKAKALLKTSKIYKNRGQFLQAKQALNEMSMLLEHLPVGALHFEHTKVSVWLAYSETDYKQMDAALNKGFLYFKNAVSNSPLHLFKLHMLASIMAQKVGDQDNKYVHLNHAQALLHQHQLDQANLALVYYHHALFSQYEPNTTQNKSDTYVTFLQKILTLDRTLTNFWVHDEAITLLVTHFIERDELNKAEATLFNLAMTPQRLYLKGNIAFAQNNTEHAYRFYVNAYDEAILSFDKATAMAAAFKLYQLSMNSPQQQAKYKAYIEANGHPDWLKQHNLLAKD